MSELRAGQCCKRDHDVDGNCDVHPAGMPRREGTVDERLASALDVVQRQIAIDAKQGSAWPGLAIEQALCEALVETRAHVARLTAIVDQIGTAQVTAAAKEAIFAALRKEPDTP